MSQGLDDYSVVADRRLDDLEASDPGLYDDVLTMCQLVFQHPDRAQAMSTTVQTPDGMVLRLPVPGRYPYKVFWTSAAPRIEAVFPHP